MEENSMEVNRNTGNAFFSRLAAVLLLSGILLITLSFQAAASSNTQSAAEGKAIFDLKCKACHSIGGGSLVGPDLEGVIERRDQEWLVSFMAAPDQMIAAGDPIATGMLVEYNNVAMPNLALSDVDIEALLAYFETGETTSLTAGPLPAGILSRGREYFTGEQSLQNGGTPCMGCHSVGNTGSLGGGNLGPDLTAVYQRYGEAGLVSSIQNISFPTMQGVYANKALTDQEVADLLTFFEAANAGGGERAAQKVTGLLWGAGIIGAALLFGVMAIFWPRQRENLSDRLRRNAGITSRRHS
jgi:mono/diheme cytochrome c family protein